MQKKWLNLRLRRVVVKTKKMCLGCGNEKLLSKFEKDKRSKYGRLKDICKFCYESGAYLRKWRRENRENYIKHKESQRERYHRRDD